MEASASGTGAAVPKKEAEVIPAKYQSSGTSDLSFDVKEGPNTIDIALK